MFANIKAWWWRRTHRFYGEETWVDLEIGPDSFNIARVRQPTNRQTGELLVGERVITFINPLNDETSIFLEEDSMTMTEKAPAWVENYLPRRYWGLRLVLALQKRRLEMLRSMTAKYRAKP